MALDQKEIDEIAEALEVDLSNAIQEQSGSWNTPTQHGELEHNWDGGRAVVTVYDEDDNEQHLAFEVRVVPVPLSDEELADLEDDDGDDGDDD